MKKLLTLLLALVLVISMLPMAVSAADANDLHVTDYLNVKVNPKNDSGLTPFMVTKGEETIKLTYADYEALEEAYKAYLVSLEEKLALANHDPGDHHYRWAANAKYHWLDCPCGCKISMEPHVDPKDAIGDYCTCGYRFGDNADLVTLWIAGCPGIENFDKDTTEYKLNAYTYKDVKEIKISTRTFDDCATVELPEDLTLKEGENKFEIKVIAENQKATKVYTVIINKEAAK